MLDKILYQRLNRIRDELNSYIEEKLTIHIQEESLRAPAPLMSYEKTRVEQASEIRPVPLPSKPTSEEHSVSPQSAQSLRYSSPTRPLIHAPTYSASAPMESRRPLPPAQAVQPTLNKKRTIDEVLENKAETFSTMLLRLIDEKGLKDSEVYKRANIDRRLFSKIRGDEDYVPSKKTAISFCLALQLELDEAKKLLEAAGYALSTASRFDLIIMFLIENREFNIHFANIVLEDYGEGTL